MFSIKIFVIFHLFQTISSQGDSYDTSCTCTQTSSTGSFCWAWKCRTDQVTKCFSSDATVEIMTTKQRKSMKHLNIGDQILVDINNQNQPIYESVYAFIHASSNGIYDYLKITIDNNFEQPLIISSNHLIYCFNQTKPIFAGYLKIGDQLQMISKNGTKQSGSIIDIRLIKSQGFYAPLTLSGKLVVDGIVVSNYAVVANHQLAHFVMQPYRWWIYFIKSSSYSENIHWYCQVLYNLVEHINKWLFSIELYDGSIIVSNI
ncbi:unnamed protein product [Rotaria sp. Silwood1]|nr:unnamed protein product [Rotaria sp. Silwood1]CAF3496117.1 unnamed protein product [Rotaria sp. Silwood1]CAF4653799.1 unnamed protein product [Rotaria sp. Silwood1]